MQNDAAFLHLSELMQAFSAQPASRTQHQSRIPRSSRQNVFDGTARNSLHSTGPEERDVPVLSIGADTDDDGLQELIELENRLTLEINQLEAAHLELSNAHSHLIRMATSMGVDLDENQADQETQTSGLSIQGQSILHPQSSARYEDRNMGLQENTELDLQQIDDNGEQIEPVFEIPDSDYATFRDLMRRWDQELQIAIDQAHDENESEDGYSADYEEFISQQSQSRGGHEYSEREAFDDRDAFEDMGECVRLGKRSLATQNISRGLLGRNCNGDLVGR